MIFPVKEASMQLSIRVQNPALICYEWPVLRDRFTGLLYYPSGYWRAKPASTSLRTGRQSPDTPGQEEVL